jgi:hypothetical protein
MVDSKSINHNRSNQTERTHELYRTNQIQQKQQQIEAKINRTNKPGNNAKGIERPNSRKLT